MCAFFMAVVQKQPFYKKSVLKNSQENTGSRIFLLKRLLQAFAWTLYKKGFGTGILLGILQYFLVHHFTHMNDCYLFF